MKRTHHLYGKRLLSLACAFCLLLGMMTPAVAEEAELIPAEPVISETEAFALTDEAEAAPAQEVPAQEAPIEAAPAQAAPARNAASDTQLQGTGSDARFGIAVIPHDQTAQTVEGHFVLNEDLYVDATLPSRSVVEAVHADVALDDVIDAWSFSVRAEQVQQTEGIRRPARQTASIGSVASPAAAAPAAASSTVRVTEATAYLRNDAFDPDIAYNVYRVVNGVPELIATVYPDEEGWISFPVDGVSTYAVTEGAARTVEGAIYADDAFYITGQIPGNGIVEVLPAQPRIPGEVVLAAYDVNIYVNENQQSLGRTWQPTEDAVQVHFYDEGFVGELSVYHADDSGKITLVDTVEAEEGWVTFDADAFSVYAVTTHETYIEASDGNTYRVAVTYDGRTGIPENAQLTVSEILPDTEEYAANLASAQALTGPMTAARVFDIKLMDGEAVCQPAEGTDVSVTIELADFDRSAGEPRVVHIADEAGPEVIQSTATDAGVAFVTGSFSAFVVGQVVLEETITVEGETYKITVSYSEDSGLPTVEQGAALEVELMNPEDYQATAEAALESADVSVVHAFDISIVDSEGNKHQPTQDVTVKIELQGPTSLNNPRVIHIPDDEAEESETITPEETDGEDSVALSFQTSGFSRYIITQDIYWHLGNYMAVAFNPVPRLNARDWSDAWAIIAWQHMAFTSAHTADGAEAMEALKALWRDPRIQGHVVITRLPGEGDYTLYTIEDEQGSVSAEPLAEQVRVGDDFYYDGAKYGVALFGDVEPEPLVAEGDDYKVTVTYDTASGIPVRGVKLIVEEIDQETDAYADAWEQAYSSLSGMDAGRLFNIRIVSAEDESIEYQPEEGQLVDVLVELLHANYRAGSDSCVLHFTEGGVEDIDLPNVTRTGNDYAYAFQTGSFSPYMVAYTVDFYYNGYERSIPGGSSITLSEIFEDFKIKAGLDEVADVEFTDPELVSVEKEGEDWKLTSLQPFDSEEKLTVTLTDGSEIEIKVLDAQTNDTNAVFKVTNYNTTQYHTTLKSAVDFANTYNANNASRTTTILMQRDYTLTEADNDTIIAVARHPVVVDGGGHTLTFSSSQAGGIVLQSGRTEAVGGENQTLNNRGSLTFQDLTMERGTSSSAVIDGGNGAVPVTISNCTINGGADSNVTAPFIVSTGVLTLNSTSMSANGNTGSLIDMGGTNSALTITGGTLTGPTGDSSAALIDRTSQGPIYLNGATINRGGYTGRVINQTAGNIQINGCTINGQNKAGVTGPLVYVGTAGSTVTLSGNTTITGHKGASGVYAVDASASNTVNISGGVSITGNTADSAAANLRISGEAIHIPAGANFSGNVGIYSTNTYANGQRFGVKDNTAAQYTGTFVNDRDATLTATASGTNLYWNRTDTSNCTFYITGRHSFLGENTTLYFLTLDEAITAASNFTGTTAAPVNIYGMVEESAMSSAATARNYIRIQPGRDRNGNTLSHITVKRGTASGDMIRSGYALTLDDVTLDGENKSASGSMLKMTAANAPLTLNNAVMQNHAANGAGVCAVDASAVTTVSYVKVSGNTAITGNTAGGKAANLKVNGTDVLQISGSLTGTVGVTTNQGEAQQFATRVANQTGCENFVNDRDSDLIGALNGNNIFWQAKPGTLMSFAIGDRKFKTLQGAFNASANNSVIKGLVENYTLDYTESNVNFPVTIQPNDNLEWLTLKRGEATGDMITSSKGLTLKNVVLDGQNASASGSLLKMTAAAPLNMTNVTARNHASSAANVCAVDAYAASAVSLDGDMSISGNTAGRVAANLRIPSDATKTSIGAITDIVGITTDNSGDGQRFALLKTSDDSGLYYLYNDSNRLLRAFKGNDGVYWSMALKLPSSKFYITGNLSFASNVTLYYDTLEEAVDISTEFVGAATIYSMVPEYTMKEPIAFSHDITLKPGVDGSGNPVSSLKLNRGEETGTLITHNKGTLTLENVTLDGQSTANVEGPLLRSTGGAGNLTLNNVTVQNHTATEAGGCAIDASDNQAKVRLLGNTNITGNTAGGEPANLCVVGTDRLAVAGNLTGTVGVTNRLHEQPGDQFGVKENASYAIGTITNDLLENNTATSSGTTVLWSGSTVSSGNLVKLTDGTNVLKRKNGNTYVDAVYTSVNGANSAVSDVNGDNLYYANGTKYTGKVCFEFLQDRVEIGNPGVQITVKRDLEFKTASDTATDGYPFEGSGKRTKIVFMNGGYGNNTDKRFIFTGNGSNIRFENIIVDGRADQGIQADQGGLVSVGDRGNTPHDIKVTIGSGAVFQNGASNTNDQGGGFFVGNGCELIMEPGSIIQYCKSNDGRDASGGAIYLAMGELTCNGGIIRNCVCSQGGAIDCGGATDGSISDKARVYFSGSPQIYNNYDNSGNPMNYHLNYNSNEIITVVGDLDPSAKVGVSADGNAAAGHSKEGQPFGTLANGVQAKNLSSFVNDKDPRLTGAPGVGPGNEKLVVWFYQMMAYATDDYTIDGELIRTTEIDNSEGIFEPETLPTAYTVDELEDAYHAKYPYISFKTSEFTGISLSSYTDSTGISYGITDVRYTPYLQGRQWQYSMDDGEHWFPVNGREFVFHYVREDRDNVKLIKNEDTNPADRLQNVKFKLERSYPTANAYTLYTNGAGQGRGTVTDTGANGIYTTDANGEFVMNLPEGYYRLTETEAPGYELLTSPITFHVGVSMIPDSTQNARSLPCSVDSVSGNAVYAGNESDYDAWDSTKLLGAMTVSDVRQVPMHVLVQKGEGEYELNDDLRTTAYVTAALGATTAISNAQNPMAANSGYVNYHIYYGKEDPAGTFTLDTAEDVASLKGTADGIIVNDDATKVLAKDQAIYFIVYPEPRKVPYHILVSENGSLTEKADWATAGTNRTTTEFIVNSTDGVDVLNAYGETLTQGGKTYRRARVVYAGAEPTATTPGTELVWLVNTPNAVVARETVDDLADIGSLSGTDAVYIIYSSGYDLTLSKTVSGQMGDPTKDFTIYVSSDAMTESSYRDDAATPTEHTVETLTGGGKRIALTLKHGESITLKNLPQGTYTITEAPTGSSYAMTCTYQVGTAAEVTSTAAPADTASVEFELTDNTTATLNNDLPAVSPTGVELRYAPYALLMLLGCLLLALSRRRRAKN